VPLPHIDDMWNIVWETKLESISCGFIKLYFLNFLGYLNTDM